MVYLCQLRKVSYSSSRNAVC